MWPKFVCKRIHTTKHPHSAYPPPSACASKPRCVRLSPKSRILGRFPRLPPLPLDCWFRPDGLWQVSDWMIERSDEYRNAQLLFRSKV